MNVTVMHIIVTMLYQRPAMDASGHPATPPELLAARHPVTPCPEAQP